MSADDRGISADMLLIRARRMRLRAAGAETSPTADLVEVEAAEMLVSDDDAILSAAPAPRDLSPAPAAPAAADPNRIFFYRPLAGVSLAGLAWTGAIDHTLLQDAIGCAPLAPDRRIAPLMRCVPDRPYVGATRGEPALCVAFAASDFDYLQRALERADEAPRLRLASAALLPDSLADATSAAAAAMSHSLEAYRSVALVWAWRDVMGLLPTADGARSLDAAAARLLSTMRAFLGET